MNDLTVQAKSSDIRVGRLCTDLMMNHKPPPPTHTRTPAVQIGRTEHINMLNQYLRVSIGYDGCDCSKPNISIFKKGSVMLDI